MECHELDANIPEQVPGTTKAAIEAISVSLCKQRILSEYVDQSQFIDMDLTVLCNWEKNSNSKARSFQKSLDSQDFEFNRFTMVPDLLEPKQHVAPADELFFKGQLLPLQHDPREQLVQTLKNVEADLSLPLICPSEQDVANFGSLIGIGMTESRSSSFRSRHSSYWESSEKDSRDSSSSSCSNGSSSIMQDSCMTIPRERNTPVDDEGSNNINLGRKMNNLQAETRKWSWKSLFNSLKSANSSKIRTEESNRQQDRPSFSENVRNSVRNSTSMGQISTSGSTDHASKSKRLALQAKEQWQRCVNKVKPFYRKLSFPKQHQEEEEEERASSAAPWAKPNCNRKLATASIASHAKSSRSSSSTPLMKSPARKDNLSSNFLHHHHHSSRRFSSVVASCPASMRSSPHHSGVLAVVNKGSSSSTTSGNSVHDLHSAIQGAIAHCKQSQCGRS